MRIKTVFNTLGRIMFIEGILLLVPMIVSLIYDEGEALYFLIPSVFGLIVGLCLSLFFKIEDNSLHAREGFVVVALSWIILSIVGCLPFVLSKEIPSFIDAFFETVSGFTTTGASILEDVEILSKGMMFWRLFTHWVGGMGILVFVIAILPNAKKNNASSIYIMRAESTGPSVGKLVSKVRISARILYLIYFGLTVIEVVFLLLGKMNVYDAIVYSMSTAGTGGFATLNSSLGSFSSYIQIVIGIFMVLFGINFNLFYFLLIGKFKDFFKNEELRWYLGIIAASVAVIALNVFFTIDKVSGILFGETLKDSFLQVSSIITTTGFSTRDFNTWPMLSKFVLVLLMFVGASAGSTGGGIKVSRIVLIGKSIKRDIKSLIHPNSVQSVYMDGRSVDEEIIVSCKNYMYTYIVLFIIFVGLISINGFDFETTITSVIACINNIGPGLGLVGPASNFSMFSGFSKVVLALSMLFGRLEIYPMLLLFSPRSYRK